MTASHGFTRALIPCGGKGTRMLRLSGGRPKELIEVAGVPLVVRVAQECARSGITDLMVVIAPGKESIADCLAPLAGSDGFPVRIAFAEQREPRGLADAIRLGREFADEGAIAVALPDNLFAGAEPALRQVIRVALAARTSAVAMVGISADEAGRRGATSVYAGSASGGEFRITRIPDKGAKHATFSTGGAPMAYTGVGRYAFGAELWATIDEVERVLPGGAELDDVPVMQALLARGLLTGCVVEGKFLDVGIPAGWEEANALLGG